MFLVREVFVGKQCKAANFVEETVHVGAEEINVLLWMALFPWIVPTMKEKSMLK
jgi:hypothetical protein